MHDDTNVDIERVIELIWNTLRSANFSRRKLIERARSNIDFCRTVIDISQCGDKALEGYLTGVHIAPEKADEIETIVRLGGTGGAVMQYVNAGNE